MLNPRYITRICRLQGQPQFLLTLQSYCQSSSSSDSDEDVSKPLHSNDENKRLEEAKKTQDEKRELAKLKMKELIQSLSNMPQTASEVPIFRPEHRKMESRDESSSKGGKGKPQKDSLIDPEMEKAVKEVAKSIGGEVKETESELMTSLRSQESAKQSLSELLVGMKIDRSEQPSTGRPFSLNTFEDKTEPVSRLREYRREKLGAKTSRYSQQDKIELFAAAPLNIFPQVSEYEGKESLLPTWDAILKFEMELSVSETPRGPFEEMIQWTEQGKLWQFPIDNEVGLEDEKACSFADHIFLEQHLEGWCPAKGPIRHFMELVCTGLSKNPYITVQRKMAHIKWYKDYFESKKEVLQEVGAM